MGVPPRFPDQEKDTIAKGHSPRPRFVTYADSDFLDVAAALGKILMVGKSPPYGCPTTNGDFLTSRTGVRPRPTWGLACQKRCLPVKE
ncbi:MAG: hypothetical protein Q8O04_07735 [Deltaproteobacteria bacterium]|nr:hypothetical protein [Deltaproteobacteria bacterium]